MACYQVAIDTLMKQINAEAFNDAPLGNAYCQGLSEDSRAITENCLFIARPGLESDGRRYIHQAVSSGAVAVLAEHNQLEQFTQAANCPVKIYSLTGVADKLGELAASFYNHPSKALTMIGVTGTNGKTSTSQLLAQVLEQLSPPAAVMGTLGNGLVNQLQPTTNTTVDALSVHQSLAEFVEQKVQYTCMEVSSHALSQGRVNAVEFDCAVFTNLSRDHLDYHGDMEAYLEAKKLLLVKPELSQVIINADDAYGKQLLNDPTIMADKYSFSITSINARSASNSVWTESVRFSDSGINAEVLTPWGKVNLHSPLIGQFNLSNCLAVITTLGAMGFNIKQVAAKLAKVSTIAGRMERFGGEDQPLVIVDYAHTPDALEQVLQALRPHVSKRIWCVFGCGGDRDRGKRPLMARVAEEYADHLILTSDNPRSEPIEQIIEHMLEGLHPQTSREVEFNRKQAIYSAIRRATKGDVVVIAGKGHEQYQQMADEKIAHCDVEIVKDALAQGTLS